MMIRFKGTSLVLGAGIAFATAACSGIGAKYSPPLATVTVDFATQKGPATQRASGFLHGIKPGAPPDDMVRPLKPGLFRFDAKYVLNVDLFRRLAGYGADIQAIISHAYGEFYSESQAWPGDGGDWTAWENLVERVVLNVRANGNRVLWDVWNEPDDTTFWKRNQEQFFETWRRTVVTIRRLDPDALIVGPSTGLGEYLHQFLLYAKEKHVLPDVVSWHELWLGNLEHDHAASVRMFMSANGIPERPFSINEFQQAEGRHKPGVVAAWLTHVEEEKADSAAYACWDDPLGYSDCSEPTLDGLLTIEKETRAGWFAHKGYADITGTLVQVDSQVHSIGLKIAGVAGMDADHRSAQLLLGRREISDATESGGVTVVFQNISEVPYLMRNGMVLVQAERIPDAGLTELSRTKLTIHRSYPVLDNAVRVELPDFDAWGAYIVKLKEPVTESSSSP